MKIGLRDRPISSAILAMALCIGTAAYAQDVSNTNNNKSNATSGDEFPDIVEIDVFGGVSVYGQVQRGLTTQLVDGGVVGLGVTWNATRRIGLEVWGDWNQANVEFRTP